MNYGIILIGGISKRFENDTPKQFAKLGDKELFELSLDVFLNCDRINEIVLVVNENYIMHVNARLEKYNHRKKIFLVKGGISRQQSVYNALKYLTETQKITAKSHAIIHDGARPLVNESDIISCIRALENDFDGVSLALGMKDTLVQLSKDSQIDFLDRDKVFRIQTPQAFKLKILFEAHQYALDRGLFETSDDLQILRLKSSKISLIPGREQNLKITTYEEFRYLQGLIGEKNNG